MRRSPTTWIRAFRPLALLNLFPMILVGVAGYQFRLDLWDVFFAGILAALWLFIIIGTNEYYDHSLDGPRTLLSGGSGAVGDESIPPRFMKYAALLSAVALIGFLFLFSQAPAGKTLGVAAIGLLAVVLYEVPPFRLSMRGGGSVLQGIGVGFVLPFLGSALTRPHYPFSPRMTATFVLLAAASHLATARMDRKIDKKNKKHTLYIRFPKTAIDLFVMLLFFVAITLFPRMSEALWPRFVPIAVVGLLLPTTMLFRHAFSIAVVILATVLPYWILLAEPMW